MTVHIRFRTLAKDFSEFVTVNFQFTKGLRKFDIMNHHTHTNTTQRQSERK